MQTCMHKHMRAPPTRYYLCKLVSMMTSVCWVTSIQFHVFVFLFCFFVKGRDANLK